MKRLDSSKSLDDLRGFEGVAAAKYFKILKLNDFYFAKEPSTPCYLTNNGRKIFIKMFEIKMHKKIIHPLSGLKVDYRRCLDLQIQQLVQVIKGEKESYEPFKTVL